MQDKIDCNNINKMREEKNPNSIYTGSTTSRAYVQSSKQKTEKELEQWITVCGSTEDAKIWP